MIQADDLLSANYLGRALQQAVISNVAKQYL
jgi:hypothetical protein